MVVKIYQLKMDNTRQRFIVRYLLVGWIQKNKASLGILLQLQYMTSDIQNIQNLLDYYIIQIIRKSMQVDPNSSNSQENTHPSHNNSNDDKGINHALEPQSYAQWYQQLTKQQKLGYYTPEQYNQWYYYQLYQLQIMNGYHQQTYNSYYNTSYNYSYNQNIPQYPSKLMQTQPASTQPQKNKLSRNQKRKLKKKQLQEQYQKQKKQIGKWVELQRKDLVQGLKKIEQQQQRIKQKRKEKLSHLIQIHKEVYKHIMKKNKGKIANNNKERVGTFRRKKKKPSHIKKMKEIYELIKNGEGANLKNVVVINPQLNHFPPPHYNNPNMMRQMNQNEIMRNVNEKAIDDNQQDYITESQSQVEDEHKKQNEEKLQQQKAPTKQQKITEQIGQQLKTVNPIKQIKVIDYKTVGKLNGYVYHGITLRQWVDHVPSANLEDIVLKFINRLAYKQAIKKVNQPQKARKLIIAGLHECRRTLWTKIDKKKSKMLIVALNIERNNLQRGTDDQLQQVLNYAYQAKIPIIHISTRSKLGRAFTGKFGPRITMVSVVNYEGYEDMMELILEQWKAMKRVYQNTNSSCFKF